MAGKKYLHIESMGESSGTGDIPVNLVRGAWHERNPNVIYRPIVMTSPHWGYSLEPQDRLPRLKPGDVYLHLQVNMFRPTQ